MPASHAMLHRLKTRSSTESGFTLVEVLIAVGLTALVGVISYSFLNTAIDAYSTHAERAKRLDQINLFFTRLGRDMLHTVNRPIYDEFNDEKAALEGGFSAEYLLSLSRGGWPNPREMPRSSLQRVAYGLNDTRIERVVWPVLDRVDSENVYKSVALDGVNNVVFRFLKEQAISLDNDEISNDWEDSWPLTVNGEPGAGLPVAMEVTLDLEGWGEVRRIFAVSAAGVGN